MDALIILTIGGSYAHSDRVPWSRDPLLPGEQRVRYALENDRDTEPLSVIAGKAYAYQHAATPAWERRYGRFPLPIWLGPTNAEWKRSSPPGERHGQSANG